MADYPKEWERHFTLEDGRAVYVRPIRPQDEVLYGPLPRGGDAGRCAVSFMWHALNAYDDGEEIIADFVGYDTPDHFAPHNALFYRVMQGEMGEAKTPGTLRRYRINLVAHSLREEILDCGSHEFPMIDPRAAMQKHDIAYLTAGTVNYGVNTGVKRVDFLSGKAQVFDFGRDVMAGEPVFATQPGATRDQGWLIVQCLDGSSERAFFALFDAAHVDAGPIARIHLPHHLPISFHGSWKAG